MDQEAKEYLTDREAAVELAPVEPAAFQPPVPRRRRRMTRRRALKYGAAGAAGLAGAGAMAAFILAPSGSRRRSSAPDPSGRSGSANSLRASAARWADKRSKPSARRPKCRLSSSKFR